MMAEGKRAVVASCHCGDVTLRLPSPPEEVTHCNCSLCRRTGFWGIYYPPEAVAIAGRLNGYVRDDLDEACLTLWRCAKCGCVTHWTGLGVHSAGRMGVNARMLDAKWLEDVPVKQVDGASW